MTIAALVRAPLRHVNRGPLGAPIALTEGHINHVPLKVTVTTLEIHIAWADRAGPVFVMDLHHLIKAAADEIETILKGERGV